MNINEVAQWVIDNRYPKSEFEKLSDHELYHGLIEKIELVLKQNSGNTNVLRSLPSDKDINDEAAKQQFILSDEDAFVLGAKWMRKCLSAMT